jgi:hypothetical protein
MPCTVIFFFSQLLRGGTINVLVIEILLNDFLLNNEARNVFISTLKNEYQQSLDLNACLIERGLMVVTTACPQDDSPLSYDRVDGEWLVRSSWLNLQDNFLEVSTIAEDAKPE